MKLLVIDVEGTLFQTVIRLPGAGFYSTIWQAIARKLGPQAELEEVETHKKWKWGQYRSYVDWMKDTISIHIKYGLSKRTFDGIILSAKYNPGVLKTLAEVDRKKYEIVLMSGGFRELALRAQTQLKILHAFAACEYSFSKKGKLINYNLIPSDFEGKVALAKLMLQEYQLGPKDWIFVGDGPNDIPAARAAPISVGYRPHEQLRDVVTHVIRDFSELIPILDIETRGTK